MAIQEIRDISHKRLGNVNFSIQKESKPGIGAALGVYATFPYRSVTWLGQLNKKGEIRNKTCARSIKDEVIQVLGKCFVLTVHYRTSIICGEILFVSGRMTKMS